MLRLTAGMIVVSLIASMSFAAPVAPRVTVAEYPDVVVLYVHDLDLLRAAYPSLTAEVRLAGIETTYRVDLAADYQTPAMLIRKALPTMCGKVSVTLRAGEKELFRNDLATMPMSAATPRLPMTDVKAFIERGAGLTTEPPAIVQPDIARIEALPLADAERVVNMNAIVARVESDVNYPLVSANNNCALSRQTAHPDDPTRRSCYVPLKSQTYDEKTGVPGRVIHYLAEVPLDPEWLKGTEDATIQLGARDIKIHATDTRWPPTNPRGQLITGEGSGGLGQLVGSVALDADGNIYYSASVPSHVVRFNVAKARFEAPPIDIMAAMSALLPKKDDLPAEYRGAGTRWDWYGNVTVGGGRLFFSPKRFGAYGQLYCNGVVSFPLEDWYDAEKFRAGMQLAACSWPGTPISLYDKWAKAGGTAPQIGAGVYHDGKYYLSSYSHTGDGPWCITLNPDGSAKSVSVVKAADVAAAWAAAAPKLPAGAGGIINWTDYGVLTATRSQLDRAITGTRGAKEQGRVTICYDAIAAMDLARERYADILSNLHGPALAPCYMAVDIPDKPGHILGVGEYGYYLADLDLAGMANGIVTEHYISLDTGKMVTQLPVKVGLGPYGHLWWREGNKRYLIMVGYTGIARMLYSVDGKPLERFDSVLLRMAGRGLDGAPPPDLKWYQYPVAGIDGRVFLTGTHEVDRGGRPNSNGLMAFSFAQPKETIGLSHMTRACSTTRLRTRVLYDPDGRKRQEFVLVGGMSIKAYLDQMGGKDLPENRDAKEFFYACAEGGEPKDLFGFSLPVVGGKSGASCQVFSRDRRYLVMLQQGCILTFDVAAKRYVDGCRIEADVWRFCKPDYYFNVAPDDRIFFCAQAKNAAKATFYELEISPAGAIVLKPHLTLTGPDAAAVKSLNGAVIAFVPDPKGDGSYDLCLGPYWRTPGTQLRLITDFLPPRAP